MADSRLYRPSKVLGNQNVGECSKFETPDEGFERGL